MKFAGSTSKNISVLAILLVLDAAHSYILLTANMDDVQAIARQMLASPVADQIGKIWRRATAQFNQRLKSTNVQKRAEEGHDSETPASSPRSRFLSDSFRRRGRRVLNELSELTDSTHTYMETLRRVFNEFTKEQDD